MILKDIVDVANGNDEVTISRCDFYPGIGTDCVVIYSGRCGDIPEMIYPLTVVALEPNDMGFNVDVEVVNDVDKEVF